MILKYNVDIECRLSRHKWEMLDEDEQAIIKTLSHEYSKDFGLNWEYDYFWLRFNPEEFLLARLKFPIVFAEVFD